MTDPDGQFRMPEARRSLEYLLRPLFLIAAVLAVLAWLFAGLLIAMAVSAYHSDVPENMTGAAVAFVLPPVLMAAFGLTSTSAWCYHGIRRGRASLVIATATTTLALVMVCISWSAFGV